MSSTRRIAVLGGGVSGITTAIVLQMHGFRTKVYTHRRLDEVHPTDATKRPAELATIHAAASILPHSAKAEGVEEIMRISQLVFHRLAFSGNFGVRQQRHYELYETKPTLPGYASVVSEFTLLDDRGTSFLEEQYKGSIPIRSGANGIWGWHFNAFFCETPTYIASLYELYQATGGQVELVVSEIDIKSCKEESGDFRPDAIVVCAGYSSPWVLGKGKLTEVPVTRGHMAKIHIHQVPHDARDQYFSYNYSPSFAGGDDVQKKLDEERFTDIDGVTADVYFYPRSDGWLLGGSRQPGVANLETGVWRPTVGNATTRDSFEASRKYMLRSKWLEKIPERIWSLNRELVLKITSVDIDRFPSTSYIGYRFLTDPIATGIDHEATAKINVPVFGNYGHGGSGYTLSWGCAWKLLVALEKQGFATEIEPFREISNVDRQRRSAMSMLTILEELAIKEKAVRDQPNLENFL